MKKIIDITDRNKMIEYEVIQYDNFVRLSALFEEFIFQIDPEFWKEIVDQFENTLCRCDEIDYQSDSTAIAYSLWHFLDRYHRMQIMCKFLLEKGYLNWEKQYDVLDVGTGPSQTLFALSDHFRSLNIIEKNVLCTVNPDYVEQSFGFRNFIHHFVEFALSKGIQYLVPFHFGRTQDAFEIEFDEHIYELGGWGSKHRKQIKYRYDITVFNNFLTTKSFTESYADTLRQICKYTRNHGLVIVVGASDKSEKYQKMYPAIDDIILNSDKDRYFDSHWKKVFEQQFNYKYDDKFGEIICNYFNSIIQYLRDNDLWEQVPNNSQKEFLQNTKERILKNVADGWKGVAWKMVVYKKSCKPRVQRIKLKKVIHGNHYRLVDDMWKYMI